MDSVYIPDFLWKTSTKYLFHRIGMFIEMCESFTHKLSVGQDSSLDVMRKLIELRPIHDFNTMNQLFEIIKEVVLEIHEAKQNETLSQSASHTSGCINCAQFDSCVLNQRNDASDINRFSTDLKDDFVHKIHNLLHFCVNSHEEYLTWLRNRHKRYIEANQTVIQTVEQIESLKDLIAKIEDKNSKKLAKHQQALEKLQKKLLDHRETEAQAMLSFTYQLNEVKEYRETQLKLYSDMLKEDVQKIIQNFLLLSIDRLKELKVRYPMSKDLSSKLDNFDACEVASSLYESLSTRYLSPIYGEEALTLLIPQTKLIEPTFKLKDKVDLAIGFISSSECLLNPDSHISAMRFEELYVYGRDNVSCTKTGQLKLRKGQKVKQKFVSRSGNVGFGWIRNVFGKKKYGFYNTSDTQITP